MGETEDYPERLEPREGPLLKQFPPCQCETGQRPEWFCKYCRQSYCRQCVAYREVRGEQLAECRECGRELVELREGEEERKAPPPFLPGLFKSPLYPFGRGARVGLCASTVLFLAVWALYWGLSKFVAELAVPVSAFVLLLAGAFFWLYLIRIVEESAYGHDAPAWPEFDNIVDSLLSPLASLVMVAVVCFLPAVVYSVIGGIPAGAWDEDGLLAGLIVLGVFLMPMAVLSTTLFGTPWAMRPLFLVRSILVVPVRYAMACVLPGLAMGMVARGVPIVAEAPAYRELPYYIVAGIYLLMVEMHLIGLVYRTGSHRLKWFEKPAAGSGAF